MSEITLFHIVMLCGNYSDKIYILYGFYYNKSILSNNNFKEISMASNSVNATLPEPLANHVARMSGGEGYYETSSEYIRDLIHRDMEKQDIQLFKLFNSFYCGWKRGVPIGI